jgi:hypothetical protein
MILPSLYLAIEFEGSSLGWICLQPRYNFVFRDLLRNFSKSSAKWETTALANDQLAAQIFNTFITILYTYMFRAISCSSSGGQIWPPEDEQDIDLSMYM